MTDCKQINEQMVDYLYQELEASERGRFEVHLQSCARCQLELAAYERTRELMQDLPEQDPPPSIAATLLQAAARPAVKEKPDFWQRLRESLRLLVMHPAMTAAVTLVAVLGVSFYVYKRAAPPRQEKLEHLQVAIDEPQPVAAMGKQVEEAAAADDLASAQAATKGRGAPAAAPLAAGESENDKRTAPRRMQPAEDARPSRRLRSKELFAAEEEKQGQLRQRLERKGASGYPPAERKDVPPLAAKPKAAHPKGDADLLDSFIAGSRGPAKSASPSRYSQEAVGAASEPSRSSPAAKQRAAAPLSQRPTGGASGKMMNEEVSAGLELLRRGDLAQAEGRCLEALALFNQAIAVEPELRGKVLASARRCANQLASDDETQLRQASQDNANLTGFLEAELLRVQRARQAQEKAKKGPAKQE